MKKAFPIEDILSITTDRRLNVDSLYGIKHLTAYLFGDPDGAVFTLTLAHLRLESARRLLAQYPQLPREEDVNDDTDWDAWLTHQKELLGETLEVESGEPLEESAPDAGGDK